MSNSEEIKPQTTTKRSCGRPPKKKYRRGRSKPSGSKETEQEVPKVNRKKANKPIKNNDEKLNHRSNHQFEPNYQLDLPVSERQEPVVCGICLENCDSQEKFDFHAMEIHNGLARVAGNDQDFNETDKLTALTKTLSTLKKLRCLKDGCEKEFISLAGYRYHLNACQNKIFGKCPICGKKILESRIDIHVSLVHPVKEASLNPTPRDAAKRAREKLKNFVKGDEENENTKSRKRVKYDENYEPDEEELSENSDLEDYSEPADDISDVMLDEWKKELELNGNAMCTNSGCEKIYNNFDDLKNHFIICLHSTMKLCYVCSYCDMRFKSKNEVITHLDVHSSVRKNGDGLQKRLKSSWDNPVIFMKKFFEKNCSDDVFISWQPLSDSWIPLSPEKYKIYLPKEVQSISFRTSDTSQPASSDWANLNLFSAITEKDDEILNSNTLFVGGPVWAMSWCPTPMNKITDQYLALFCHQSMEAKISTQTAVSCPGMIQIWQITNDNSLQTEFVLGIAQDFGVIWALEWCPSGCWEEDETENDDILPRLGLLAAACSDGNVYIYSLPVPNSLPKREEFPIFRTNQSVLLQIDPVSKTTNCSVKHQCVCISWLRYKGHSKLASGYTNGTVALWDLTTIAPMLIQEKSEEQIIISPYTTFQAHSTVVSDIAWAPFCNGLFLATVGTDRQMSVWSTDNLSWPSNSYRTSKLLKIGWSPFWCGTFMSADNCYNLLHNSLMYVDYGFHSNNSRCLIPHKGCIWDFSINYWLNCIASCDSVGEVVGLLLPRVLNGIITKKSLSPFRFLIYRAELLELDKDREDCQTEHNHEQNETNSSLVEAENNLDDTLDDCEDFESHLEHNGTSPDQKRPMTYDDIVSNYGINFADYNPSTATSNSGASYRPKPPTSCNLNTFPITSINRISWNPNLGSHLLVSTGGQSGLVRIHRIHWLDNPELEKLHEETKTLVNSGS